MSAIADQSFRSPFRLLKTKRLRRLERYTQFEPDVQAHDRKRDAHCKSRACGHARERAAGFTVSPIA